MDERKFEKLKTDDERWDISFDMENGDHQRGEKTILVNFVLADDERRYLISEDIKNFKQDLMDLGKFRIIKQGKEFLEK